jgi:hypothetical protein
MDKLRCAVCRFMSVTLALNVLVPAALGTPEIAPDDDSVRPAGREPDATDHA